MKILFIAPLPPPITGHSLASKTFLDELQKYHQVEVINFQNENLSPGIFSFKRLLQEVHMIKKILDNNGKADLIYFTITQSVIGNIRDLLVYLICYRSLSKMIIHLHGGAGLRKIFSNHKSLPYLTNKFFMSRLGGVVVLGPSHVDIFSKIVEPEKIHVVHNFFEDYLLLDKSEIANKFKSTSPLRIIFLSNLLQGKGHEELVTAFFDLDPSFQNQIVIDFAGGFESENAKAKFLDKIRGYEQLKYHGIILDNQKRSFFSRAHVFCLPTYYPYEGQPISILEAYGTGCVVITTNHSGIPDVFSDGINGFEVQKKSPASIKTVLEKIISNRGILLPIAINNNEVAVAKYLESLYISSLSKVINGVEKSTESTKLKNRPYRICTNCIMDTTDPNITFDARGWCDYCNNYHTSILPNWHPNEKGLELLQPLIEKIKREGKGKPHDCLIGLSGGVDSSYVAYIAKEKFGLRPMLFHVDAGWNSQEAVNNIEKLVDGLSLDLYTEVINWEEMKDLQLAFFKAQVPHVDTPQDHAFFAGLYNFAAKHGHKYILTGANYSTECVREPLEWHYHASDLRQLKDIQQKFGTRPLKTFPMADIFKFKMYYRYIKGIQVVKPLNYVPFIKEDAMQKLVDRFGWQKYPHKHYESRFTRFYEGYWLPTKFGYQKHRAHYSSLILTGQMTREEALDRISKPAYDKETIAQDFEYIAKKLEISVQELQALMDGKNKTYRDYKSRMPLISLGTKVLTLLGVQKVIIR